MPPATGKATVNPFSIGAVLPAGLGGFTNPPVRTNNTKSPAKTVSRISQFKPATEKNLIEIAGKFTGTKQQFVDAIKARHKRFDAHQLGLIYDAARR